MTSDKRMSIDAPSDRARIRAEATDWFLKQETGDMSAADWLAFSEWLGADTRHADAIDAVTEADHDLSAIARRDDWQGEAETPANRGRLYALIGGIAAVLIAVLFLPPLMRGPTFITYQTAARQHRTITIAPGIKVTMNGRTRIAVAEKGPPRVQLESGEASFDIDRPEPSRLQVQVAGLTLVDRGTIFDVVRTDTHVRIAVARGSVTIDPKSTDTRLTAGDRFDYDIAQRRGVRSSQAPEDMLSWQTGRLVYRQAPVNRVVADLSRNLSVPIALDPSLGAARFSGTLRTDIAPDAAIGDAAALIGGKAHRTEKGWRISRK